MENNTALRRKALKIISHLLGVKSQIDTDALHIEIPERLYFLSSAKDNGYENLVEGETIEIRTKLRHASPGVWSSVRIIISEESEDLAVIKKKLFRAGSDKITDNDRTLRLDYRLIREVLLDLVGYLGPMSLNLITK